MKQRIDISQLQELTPEQRVIGMKDTRGRNRGMVDDRQVLP